MKMLRKMLSVLLIISVCCSCIVCINTNAQQTFDVHDSCVKEHFDWVQNDMDDGYPSNPIGSCPYVGMSLLLSFYDAYWHDNFLPEVYETVGRFNVNTGEIENDFHFSLENTEWISFADENDIDLSSKEAAEIEAKQDAYAQFVQNNEDEYLQMYLIDLAVEAGFHDDNANASVDEYSYGLVEAEMVDFLEYYLYNVRNFTPEQVTVNKQSAILPNGIDNLFDTAKELINSGVPFIYGGSNIDIAGLEWISDPLIKNSGHILFGYDVIQDENNEVNDIILSKCWNGYATTTFYTTDYEYYPSIIWLEINEDALPHVCSDSYIETGVANGGGLCTCEIYSEHPAHAHSDRGLPQRYDSLHHYYSCYCGHDVAYPHTYTYTVVDGTYHSKTCSCGYSVVLSHVFTYTAINSTYHRVRCSCGYSYQEMHPGANSVNKPRKCSQCDYVFATFEPWANPDLIEKLYI